MSRASIEEKIKLWAGIIGIEVSSKQVDDLARSIWKGEVLANQGMHSDEQMHQAIELVTQDRNPEAPLKDPTAILNDLMYRDGMPYHWEKVVQHAMHSQDIASRRLAKEEL